MSDVDGYVQGGRENFRFRVNLKFITKFSLYFAKQEMEICAKFSRNSENFHKVGNMIDFNLLFKMFMLCI